MEDMSVEAQLKKIASAQWDHRAEQEDEAVTGQSAALIAALVCETLGDQTFAEIDDAIGMDGRRRPRLAGAVQCSLKGLQPCPICPGRGDSGDRQERRDVDAQSLRAAGLA